MKTLTLALTTILVFQLHSALAASPEEEAKFVAAAKQAFEKHNADDLVSMTCWDRVSDRIKKEGTQQYKRAVATTNVVVTLENPGSRVVRLNDGWTKNMDPRFAGFGRDWEEFSVTNRLNLTAIKELKMVYGPKKIATEVLPPLIGHIPSERKTGGCIFVSQHL